MVPWNIVTGPLSQRGKRFQRFTIGGEGLKYNQRDESISFAARLFDPANWACAGRAARVSSLGAVDPSTRAEKVFWIGVGPTMHEQRQTVTPGFPGRFRRQGATFTSQQWRRRLLGISTAPAGSRATRREVARIRGRGVRAPCLHVLRSSCVSATAVYLMPNYRKWIDQRNRCCFTAGGANSPGDV